MIINDRGTTMKSSNTGVMWWTPGTLSLPYSFFLALKPPFAILSYLSYSSCLLPPHQPGPRLGLCSAPASMRRPTEDPGRILLIDNCNSFIPKAGVPSWACDGKEDLARAAEQHGVDRRGATGSEAGRSLHGLHLQFFPVHSLDLVEGGMRANDHKGGS